MRRPFRLAAAILTAAACAIGAVSANAAVITSGCAQVNVSCTLQELVGGATITVGDLIFGNWSTDDASTRPVDLAQIGVSGLEDQPARPGLRYSANGQLSTVGLDLLDLDIGFSVASAAGLATIGGNVLELNQFVFGVGNFGGFAGISEIVFAANRTDVLAMKRVFADNLFANSQLLDAGVFPAQASIFVMANVLVVGDDAADQVSMDSFTQRFAQPVLQIPEPPTVAVLALGLAALLWPRCLGARRPRCRGAGC